MFVILLLQSVCLGVVVGLGTLSLIAGHTAAAVMCFTSAGVSLPLVIYMAVSCARDD